MIKWPLPFVRVCRKHGMWRGRDTYPAAMGFLISLAESCGDEALLFLAVQGVMP